MTQRAEGKLAGYAYLAYIVFAMSAAILSGKTTAGADTSHMLSTLRSTSPSLRSPSFSTCCRLSAPLCWR